MMRHAVTLGAALAGALVGVAVVLIPRKTVREPMLHAPEYLSPLVRQVLDQRMADHRGDMADLSQAILLVDLKTVARLADGLSKRPTLARPTESDAVQLNSWLPARFFQFSDDLQAKAAALAAAARSQNIDKVAAAYGQVMQTCVSCHGVYLREGAAGNAQAR